MKLNRNNDEETNLAYYEYSVIIIKEFIFFFKSKTFNNLRSYILGPFTIETGTVCKSIEFHETEFTLLLVYFRHFEPTALNCN